MKIKITEDCLVNGEHTEAGTVVDVPLPQANQLLISGRAEPAEADELRGKGAMVAGTGEDNSSKEPHTGQELAAAVMPRGLNPVPQEELVAVPMPAAKEAKHVTHVTHHAPSKNHDDDDAKEKSKK